MTHVTLPSLSPAAVGAYEPPAPRVHDRWSPTLRVAFRFACAWLVLVFWLDLLAGLPVVSVIPEKAAELWAPVLRWVGAHVLHTASPAVDLPNGAGDKTVFWVSHFCAFGLAIVATGVWSAIDRTRTEYRTAHEWLRVYVRYTLGATMLGYGIAKLVPSQFPALALSRYIEPYGQFSPMGVLWSFMSSSPAYGAFTGAIETLGALLLFWRRTTTLGALVLVGALANVFALNMTYDVTVKGYSLQLLLAAGFLLLPDARRVWAAVIAAPLGTRPRWQRIVPPLVVTMYVGTTAWSTWSFWRASFGPGSEPNLYGLYDVERATRNGVVREPVLSDSSAWRRVVIDRRRVAVQVMTDSLRYYRATDDSAAHRLSLSDPRTGAPPAVFAYVREGPTHVRFVGHVGSDSIELLLRRIDHTRFPLVSRGFHWVQNDNFNR